MAVSNVVTHDLLAQWQVALREDVWMFNQAYGAGVLASDGLPYVQEERDMIARAINSAFERIQNRLGFPPARRFFTQEIQPMPVGRGVTWQQFRTIYGHVIGFGVRATSLVQADAAVVYSQVDNPQVDDVATITVTTTHPADELQVFFRAADNAPSAANPQWRITPVTVTATGNTATIIGRRADFVRPSVWSQPFTEPGYYDRRNVADPAGTADFVTAVDVYRVYRDTTDAVQVATRQCGSCDPEWVTVEACLLDPSLGVFEVYDSSRLCRYPLRLRYSYEAGPGSMDDDLVTAVMRYANVLMPRCPGTILDWVTRAYDDDNKAEAVAQRYVNNPFGIQQGAVAAWLTVLNRKLGI
ncbi:hypothetical protein HC928_03770 [bacterium]|nr:hypothetical protein [bacterium]